VHKVSIIPRGRAGGYTLLLPTEDRNYMTRTHLKQQIIMMLGGRVAEEIVLHEISTGASNDIERATGTIRRMITEWGMSDELGTITFGNNNGEQVFLGRDLGRDRNYSEAVAYSIDKEVKRMMDECHAEATRLLTDNLDKLTLIAETLKVREVIQADEFIALMEGRSLEELDRQRDEVLQEQKGEAGLNAVENSATEPVQEAVKVAETAPEEVPASVEPEQAESVTETKITAEEEK
jgi:cell division protease FtsH